MNASDERGISIVREKIKNFARQTPRAQTVASDGKIYPCPPYKIIILDEADSMTQDAQSALRRIMETYARITRFCLVCNFVTRFVLLVSSQYTSISQFSYNRIIEPLASRCSKFRFKPLDTSSTSTRLQHIASTENVPTAPPVVDALIEVSGGDLRRAITYLQSASRLSSSTNPPTEITPRDIQEIAGVVPDSVVNGFAKVLGVEILTGNSDDMDVDAEKRRKLSGFELVRGKVKELMREGYSASQFLSQVESGFFRDRHLKTNKNVSCTT